MQNLLVPAVSYISKLLRVNDFSHKNKGLEEFVDRCVQLHGPARAVESQTLNVGRRCWTSSIHGHIAAEPCICHTRLRTFTRLSKAKPLVRKMPSDVSVRYLRVQRVVHEFTKVLQSSCSEDWCGLAAALLRLNFGTRYRRFSISRNRCTEPNKHRLGMEYNGITQHNGTTWQEKSCCHS